MSAIVRKKKILVFECVPFVVGKEWVGDGVIQIEAIAEEPELGGQHKKLQHERRETTKTWICVWIGKRVKITMYKGESIRIHQPSLPVSRVHVRLPQTKMLNAGWRR